MTLAEDLRGYFGDGETRVVLVGVGNPMRPDACAFKIME